MPNEEDVVAYIAAAAAAAVDVKRSCASTLNTPHPHADVLPRLGQRVHVGISREFQKFVSAGVPPLLARMAWSTP